MGLFQKKPQVSSSMPAYSVSAHKNVLIVGLGNPGKEYVGTRHNVGFAALDYFAATNEFDAWTTKKDLHCQLAMGTMGQNRVILCKPQTFINDSGQAVAATQHFYKISNLSTLVIYDEIMLGFGQLRSRVGGSDAGHNGVKSLTQHLGEDFGRLRIGIGTDLATKTNATDFVLGKFSKAEQGSLPEIIKEAGSIASEFIYSGALPHDTRNILL